MAKIQSLMTTHTIVMIIDLPIAASRIYDDDLFSGAMYFY